MKKTMGNLLCFAALFFLLTGCGKSEQNITFSGTVAEIYDGSILVTTSDEVGFDKAYVTLDSDLQLSFNLVVGQLLKITILPQIAESYPVQVTAVAIELVSDPSVADDNVSFIRADSHSDGGWDFIFSSAENEDTLLISSVRHIPVIQIASKKNLDDFIEAGQKYFQFDVAYDGNESFIDSVQKYDDAFFDENQLLILCTEETSGSIRHRIKETLIINGTLSVKVESIIPETGTDDIADWFIVLEFSKAEIIGCDKFDVYYSS